MEPDHALPPDRIMEIGRGFMASKALLSAVELGVFTALTAGPLDAETLCRRLGLHARGARDFLDALVALRLLDRREDGAYANTPDADLYLDRGKPTYLGGLLEMANARTYRCWAALTEALRTGRPQSEVRDGGDFFAAIYADSELLAMFLRAMTGLSRPVAAALARASHGASGGASSTSGPPRAPCRWRWRAPIRISAASASTCPRSGRCSSSRCAPTGSPTGCASRPETSWPIRSPRRRCW